MITKGFTDIMVRVKCGATLITYNIHHIKPHKSDTKFDSSGSESMSDDVNICLPSNILMY